MPIPPPEVEEVTKTRVACDGGTVIGGHPRVWLSIDPQIGYVECGYCDKKFVLKPGAGRGTDPATGANPSPSR